MASMIAHGIGRMNILILAMSREGATRALGRSIPTRIGISPPFVPWLREPSFLHRKMHCWQAHKHNGHNSKRRRTITNEVLALSLFRAGDSPSTMGLWAHQRP